LTPAEPLAERPAASIEVIMDRRQHPLAWHWAVARLGHDLMANRVISIVVGDDISTAEDGE